MARARPRWAARPRARRRGGSSHRHRRPVAILVAILAAILVAVASPGKAVVRGSGMRSGSNLAGVRVRVRVRVRSEAVVRGAALTWLG